jgi:tetratricopeptide (TPR) repeat protein
MRTSIKTAIFAAGIALSGVSAAQAQSFKELSDLGTQALRRGDWARAIEIRTRQLSMQAPAPEERCFIYWGLSVARVSGTGEMAQAKQDLDDSLRCLEAIPSSADMVEFRAEALRQRSILLRDWEHYDDSLADDDARQKLEPTSASSIDSSRANTLDLKGDYDGAAAVLTRAASATSDMARRGSFIVRRAWIRLKQQRVDQAMSDLAEASRISPHVAGQDSNPRAWILVELGRYDDAIAEMKSDERAGGGNAMIYAYLRGYVEAARGNFGEAAVLFKPAATAQADNATVQVALYLAQARSGQGSTAAVSAFAANLNPAKWPDAQAFYVAGKIDRAQFEAAAKFGNPRIERNRLCRMYLVAGEVALIKRDKVAAKNELGRSIELCPVDAMAQERTWAKGELGRL